MTDQLNLAVDSMFRFPAWYFSPRDEIEARFRIYHENNPHVYEEIERRAWMLYRAGRKRIGMKAIAESIRWESLISTEGDPCKINNNHVALYARLLLHRHPELDDVIETRSRRV